MPVQGLFNDDARNVGGRTRILKRHWRHENKIASAKPSVFVPSRQRKQRQKAKRNTIKSALRPVPSVVTKRSTSRRSQPAKSPVRSKTPPNESKLHDDVDDLTESKLDISHNESKREDKETQMIELEGDYLDCNNRPQRPDHLMEISDWRGIRIDNDVGTETTSSDANYDEEDLIELGSYVRLIPGLDTFGCLNFGDRGIVTRLVTSRNASVPNRPWDAQAYEVLGPRKPGMFWYEKGEIEKCPQKLFSPREWSRKKRRNSRKARVLRAKKARDKWLLEERRKRASRNNRGSRRSKSKSDKVPLETDEDWRVHGAKKLSAWKRRARQETTALTVVQNSTWPWVSQPHTERLIDMYDQTLASSLLGRGLLQ